MSLKIKFYFCALTLLIGAQFVMAGEGLLSFEKSFRSYQQTKSRLK